MIKKLLYLLLVSVIISCHKKHYPSTDVTSNPATEKKVIKKNYGPPPKVMIVNDNAAHKSVDGRYYYDFLGHRYWKNKRDGKYYLFDKSMYSNPDFKP